jgi:hypothetical protein
MTKAFVKSPSIPLLQRGRFGKDPFTKREVQKGTFPKGEAKSRKSARGKRAKERPWKST